LGAEQLMAAEKEGRKIAVEIKSFIGQSEIEDLENALGQFILNRNVMNKTEPDRELYLAVREQVFYELFEEPVGKLLLENEKLRLMVFNSQEEVIVKWVT
jgi:hypothetical protein